MSQDNPYPVTTVDLLRHGQCEGGAIYRGSTDVSLNALGQQQMQASVQQVPANWSAVISSPMIRCADFANTFAKQSHLPLFIVDGLREMSFGDWEGKRIEEIWQTQRASVDAWGRDPVNCPPPNGERADTFSTRVVTAWDDILASHTGQHLLLVTHGGVIRALLAYVLSMPIVAMSRFDVPFACVSRIEVIHTDEQHYYRLLNHNMAS